jgi:hypothetical protein
MEQITGQYGSAAKITLAMGNLNKHNPGSFHEVSPPDKAKACWDRFELVYTPEDGRSLNMAEIELNILRYIFLKALQFVYLSAYAEDHGLCPWMNAWPTSDLFLSRWITASADFATGG